jgi:hypothetical protein
MSEVSVLSQEYQTASELSRTLNAALITLKKARLGLPGAEMITAGELEQSQRCLADILDALRQLLQPVRADDPRAAQLAATRVPGALVTRVRSEQQGDLGYYLEDLTAMAARLRGGVEMLTEDDLERLDLIAAAADSETSSVFRRLMRT